MKGTLNIDEILEFITKNEDRTWIFVDTETLGFNPTKHQLTEIAAIAVDMKTLNNIAEYHEKAKLLSTTRLRLDIPYNGPGPSYRDLMKMTNYGEPIKNRVYIEEKDALAGFIEFIEQFDDPLIIAHNASFDKRYINSRYNIYNDLKNPLDDYEVFDTLSMMRKYFTAFVATEAKRYKHRWLTKEESQHILEMRRVRKALQASKNKKMSLKLGKVADALNIDSDGWHSAKFDVETLISITEKIFKLFKDGAGKELKPEKYFL
tara:strand:+ start:3133 stop:3918 length:786 start_codon:yes stop_codon:yes gene_type:complete